MEENKQMSFQELGLKAKSKKELYNLLVSDVGIFLPLMKEANAKFISDILSGAKPVRDIPSYLPT